MARRRRNARRAAPSTGQRLAVLRDAFVAWSGRLLAAFALLAVAGAGLFGLDALRGLPVERIVVAGKLEHLRQQSLRDSLATELGDGLLFLDLRALRETLEALPWVYRAELRRRFPDTLEVHVVEQVPIARWGSGAFLNHEARVIDVTDAERWSDLPRLRGPEGSEARLMARYRTLRDELASLMLTPVALEEDDFGQLRARLDNGVDLQFGDRDFSARLQRFTHLWRRELDGSSRLISRVDLRYEAGVAVAVEPPEQIAGLATTTKDG